MSDLRRSDGGAVVLALAIVAAGGTLLLTLVPAARWLLPAGALALAAYLFIARERRIRRRLNNLRGTSYPQPARPALPAPAAPAEIEGPR